jgi:Flp pilus assembly protein protease CpaA
MLMSAKRAASAALALLLAVSFAEPSGARALSEAGFEYTVSDGAATVTGCTSTCPTTLVIPATLGGNAVTTIGISAFYDNDLTSVTIPNSVTTIGGYAFSNNHAITSVTIGNSVTSIGASAFYDNDLTSVTIPNSVTSIGEGAFMGNALTTVTIPNSVTAIGSLAFASNALTSVTISDSVTSIGEEAFNDNRLTSVTFLGNAPTDGGRVFINNFLLTSVTRSHTATGWGSTWSDVPVIIADVRATATVKPSMSGTVAVGKTLTAAPGTWTGYPTPTFTYKWYACTRAVTAARTTVPLTCKVISGATRSTFKITTAQRGKYVAVLVTGASLGTAATTWLSTTSVDVRATAIYKPAIRGTTTVGKTLTAAKGTWTGYPTPTFTYQWYACTRAVTVARKTVPSTCVSISDATRSTFNLTTAQRGKYVAVLVTGTSLRTTATTWLSKTTSKVR